MSRIKDLLAEEQDIDDLKPLSQVERALIEAKLDIDKDFKEYMWKSAECSWGEDDEGHEEVWINNFQQIVEDYAEAEADTLVEKLRLNLSDEEYKELDGGVYRLAERRADELEGELLEEAREDE